MDRLTLNVTEAARLIGINKNAVYALCKTPGFPAIELGRRVLIPREALEVWLNEKATGQNGM